MRGLISLVIPTYNVARYLPDFLTSLEQQTIELSDLDIVFVDDGSTDESGEILKKWVHLVAPAARVISKPNGGLCSARNAGLDVITNRWVNFCDPDDVLPPDYFEIVTRFLSSRDADNAHLVSTNLHILDDATGEVRDEHPLRFKFADGDRVVDLDQQPEYIHLQAASAFYRRDVIESEQLRFDHLVQPNFEDGYLTALYLAAHEHPRVALLSEARYFYRHRDDGSSLVQDSWTQPAKYTDVTRYGYLRLLESVRRRRGRVPIWVQNLVIYDLNWFFRQDERVHSAIGSLPREVTAEFHRVLRQIMEYVDVETIEDYRLTPMSPGIRSALIIGTKGHDQRPRVVPIMRVDADQQIAEVRYFYGGELPHEEFRSGGSPVAPIHAKIRAMSFLAERMASERIVWLPATKPLSVTLDGLRKPVVLGGARQPRYSVTPTNLLRDLAGRAVPVTPDPPSAGAQRAMPRTRGATLLELVSSSVTEPVKRLKRQLKLRTRVRHAFAQADQPPSTVEFDRLSTRTLVSDWLARQAASRGAVRRSFGDAWVFTDRDNMAQDNAEHLYRHVRSHHSEVNAWFVIDRDSEDWGRLAADGFRLVSYGTRDHTLLMLNCRHLISSQIDHYVVRPIDSTRFGNGGWRFTFLQHGVTKDDLSRWLNNKGISLFVTATRPEFQSIAGDHTRYVYTTKETQLTGFPRHDRLLRLAEAQPPDVRRLLLVMPTWRRHLLGEPIRGGNDRRLLPGFWETEYAQEWTNVVESERLARLAADTGLEIMFVPHPNMNEYFSLRSFPAHVRIANYRGVDIQEIFARGALLLTDYSSNAFEMAYIKRPVVYFQFDRREFFSGAHVYRQGSWSYDDDGFGPVALTASAAIDEVEQIINRGLQPADAFAQRMQEVFPFRDGECCERVYQAIRNSTRPAS
jgi:glycosyltransferase involved in cell wall biosynthesis